MKKFLLLLFTLFLCMPVHSQILNGEVKYTDTEAQRLVLENTPPEISQTLIQNNFYDINKSENSTAILQGYTSIKDRILGHFSDGSYAIKYLDNPKYVWYYNSEGILTHTEKQTSSDYPYKTYKYNTRGQLINMTLRVSEDETFIFTPSGTLIAHWVGKNCFDKNGNIIMTRNIEK